MTRLIVLLCLLSGCPKPLPTGDGPAPGVITCGTEAIQKCAGSALPGVNGCLSGKGDVTSCLLGLIQPAGCVTYEVVACLTRHEGNAAMRAFEDNANDSRDAWRANRALEFLDHEQVRFAD